jgi:ergothioneine biosynthesis protein EgtB
MNPHLSKPEHTDPPPEHLRCAALAAQYAQVRRQTESLAQPLTDEDCALQSMPDASPVKWHLAHTTWFFETFVLEQAVAGYRPFHSEFRVLFNSYYVTVGARHLRHERGLLSRPGLGVVRDYRRHVDTHMARLFAGAGLTPALLDLIELGVNHEQQHQELILTDLKHLLSRNPLRPAYAGPANVEPPAGAARRTAAGWIHLPDGIRRIGHGGDGFHFDNEGPRHRVFIDAFAIAAVPVTAGEYAEFVADGGYQRPELWLSEGWDVRTAHGWTAPLYWQRAGDAWQAFTLHGMRSVNPDAPVCHVSFFEADAYARWAQSRLPTEAEWETFAVAQPVAGNLLEDGHFHPAPPRAEYTAGAHQVYGDVWEWTRSSYEPYPGYRTAPGAVGEYNGKFMSNQYVLRGGSCATPASHIRATYRNFFPAAARWQFSGIRLARDPDA